MSDHVLELLGAYLDGELYGRQLRKVEMHLEGCQTCRGELQSLQALSATLRAAPLPDFPTPERFATQLALHLPRTPAKPAGRRALEVGWWLAPVGLLAAWIFLSTTLLLSNAVTIASDFGLLNSSAAQVIPDAAMGSSWSGALGQFGLLPGDSLQWAEQTELFTRATVPPIIWQVSIALLYLSWMAIWWARHTHQGHNQPLDGGSRPTVN